MSHLRRVRTGLDRLIEEDFATLSGSNVALVTNGTALSAHLTDTVAAFVAASGLRLRAIFAPEHGFLGATQAGEVVWDGTERRTGVPIYSLYGRRLEPTPEMLDGVDVIVYDMQDVGARYYTYLATLRNVLHTASRLGRRVVICDRPNPLGGAVVEGFPPYEKEFSALVSPAPMPIRYGLTVGEYARWLVNHLGWEVELEVVPLSGWRRDLSYEETGLIWAPPSPNVPTISSVWAYAGTCLIEGTNLSEGRGTTLPFEQFGAPWVDGFRLADQLNALELPGVFFRPVAFTPTFSKHAGLRCEGVHLHVLDRRAFRPVATGVALLTLLRGWEGFRWVQHGDSFFIDRLLATDQVRKQIDAGASAEEVLAGWEERAQAFQQEAREFWLYE